jgi:hypothetical protein
MQAGREDAPKTVRRVQDPDLPEPLSITAAHEKDEQKGREGRKPADAGERLVIAVCLPDGLVEGRSGLQLVAGEDKLELAVARWTGAVSVRPVRSATDKAPPEALAEAPQPREGAP